MKKQIIHILDKCPIHCQQIIAICIDQQCFIKQKAICQIELYNQHNNHKNISLYELFAQWTNIQSQIFQIRDNINPKRLYDILDSLIQDFYLKVKQVLIQIRKQLQQKIQIYFQSEPVQKIKIGLIGMQKVLARQLRQLNPEEVLQAKFFNQVYGITKLNKDTKKQYDVLQNEIMMKFTKLKQQMFMDYSKFNALFKAKQYEYCELIKQMKQKLYLMEQKYKQQQQFKKKFQQQNKIMNYQYNKLKKQLKTKSSLLNQTIGVNKIITKKYNQNIQKQSKYKLEFTSSCSILNYAKGLTNVSKKIVRITNIYVQWPQIVNLGKIYKKKCLIKVNRLDVGSWILFGAFHPKLIQKNQYEFYNYDKIGHGCYFMDNNRWVYSHINKQINCSSLGFEIERGDIIKIEAFPDRKIIKINRMVQGQEQSKMQLEYSQKQESQIHYGVALKGPFTQIQII